MLTLLHEAFQFLKFFVTCRANRAVTKAPLVSRVGSSHRGYMLAERLNYVLPCVAASHDKSSEIQLNKHVFPARSLHIVYDHSNRSAFGKAKPSMRAPRDFRIVGVVTV